MNSHKGVAVHFESFKGLKFVYFWNENQPDLWRPNLIEGCFGFYFVHSKRDFSNRQSNDKLILSETCMNQTQNVPFRLAHE